MIRRCFLLLALLCVGFLPSTARAAAEELRLDLSPGGAKVLTSGMWVPDSGTVMFCESASCSGGGVTLIVGKGSGEVRSSPMNPVVFNISGLQAVSVSGECATIIINRTDERLKGRLLCRGLQDGTRSVSVRGNFSVGAFGMGTGPIVPGDAFEMPAFDAGGQSLPETVPTVPNGMEIIKNYDVTLDIHADGTLGVTEEITYDFEDEERHGIERFIPISQRWEPDPKFDRVLKIDDVQVSSPDAPDDVETSSGSGQLSLRVGDADTTITGVHRYTLTYTARGAFNPDEDSAQWDGTIGDHDELFWNAIGDEWDVPIQSASVTVHAPVEVIAAACYAGPEGATTPCAAAEAKGRVALFEQPGLYAFQGLSVGVALPVGAIDNVAPILRERWSPSWAFPLTPVRLVIFALMLVGIVGGLLVMMWKHGRDRIALGGAVEAAFATDDSQEHSAPLFADEGSPVEFAPPDGIHPGQMGTLVDGVANALDVTATLVDLAGRGFIRIEEVPKDRLFGKDDYRFIWMGKDDVELLSYERTLLSGLFASSMDGTSVLLSDLRLRFSTQLESVKTALYADVTQRKWFSARPDTVRTRWNIIGGLVTLLSIALFVAATIVSQFALFVVPLIVGGLIMWVGARWMPVRTAKGTGVLRRSLGFRTFITDSEAIRARFAEDNDIFTEYLPYAIVFGCAKRFAKAFQGLEDQMSEPSWYVGTHPFRPVAFAENMSDFAVATGGTMAATPGSSGSSGFGGGGSSGGGMGGGGGGSW